MCLRDFEQIWAFWEKIGLLGKLSVRKKHFGEIWAVKVKKELIQKMSVQKDLRLKLGLLGKIVAFGEMTVQKGLLE